MMNEELLQRYDALLERYERLLKRHDDILEMIEYKDEEITDLKDDKDTFISFYHERFHTPKAVLEEKIKDLLVSLCKHNNINLENRETDIATIIEYFMNQSLIFEHQHNLPCGISLASVTCEYFYSTYVRPQKAKIEAIK